MPSFGGYETVREISRDGVRSVYTARVSQNAPDIYAVKTFAPDSAELVADQTVVPIAVYRAGRNSEVAHGGKSSPLGTDPQQ